MKPSHKALLAALSFLAFPAHCAQADDGILFYHGEPELLRGGGTIRMTQEFVRAKIYKDKAKVYCRFWLHNDGKAKTVRVGFPDGSDHDREYTDEPEKLEPVLEKFRSTVNGRPVRVRLVRTDLRKHDFGFFHVKSVRFGLGETKVVEDWYELPLDSGATNSGNVYIHSFMYPMFSGASWKGKIGQATVQIDFMKGSVSRPRLRKIGTEDSPYSYRDWGELPKSTVYWRGFTKPRAQGRSVTFRRRHFEPGRADDVELYFGPMKPDW